MEALTTGTISDVAAMQRIDEVERRIMQMPGYDRVTTPGGTLDFCPVTHHFTPGLYAREIFMPQGLIVTSQIHRYRHPYVVSAGRLMVYAGGEGDVWEPIHAPHFGVTEPGTRRVLAILEDTVWTTFHVTDKVDVEEIARDILVEYENPLLREVAA